MSTSRRFPKYPARPHKSGQARITLSGRDVYLGPHGSPESWQEYQRLLTDWNASGGAPPAAARHGRLTVADVVARFLAAAEVERRNPDGSRPWSELHHYAVVARPLLSLFGSLPAAEFGPKALKQLQAVMASGQWQDAPGHTHRADGWCRRVVNRHTVRVQTLWRWAESEELVPPGSHAALATVTGLRPHQWEVRETAPVAPAPLDAVERTLPLLPQTVADVVRLLLLTGARPGEICRWTPRDVIRGGRVEVSRGSYADLGACWCVWRRDHKTRDDGGAGRFTLLCPAAQTILTPYLCRPDDTPLFRLREDRRRGTDLDPARLGRIVRWACVRAGVVRWTPYQLRHAAITRWGAQADPEAARILAGHADLGTTRLYLVDDLERAARFLGRVG